MQHIPDHPFPETPRYWEPTTELDYAGTIYDEETNHLLRVLDENVHPKRLQQFDDMIEFDLKRAASEYGEPDSS